VAPDLGGGNGSDLRKEAVADAKSIHRLVENPSLGEMRSRFRPDDVTSHQGALLHATPQAVG